MLTPKQERYCTNRAIKGLSQRQAYLDAYPKSEGWKVETVDANACRLEKVSKIKARLTELRDEQTAIITEEASWTRQNAYDELQNLIEKAKEEIDTKGEMSGPNVSAIINAVKELNNIFAVSGKTEDGIVKDIIDAVRGVAND